MNHLRTLPIALAVLFGACATPAAPSEPADVTEAPAEAAGAYVYIDHERAEQMLSNKETFFAVLTTQHCGGNARMVAALEEDITLEQTGGHTLHVMDMVSGDFPDRWAIDRMPFWPFFPAILYVEDGEVVDVEAGFFQSDAILSDFIDRNTGRARQALRTHDEGTPGLIVRRGALNGFSSRFALDGADLSELLLRDRNFAGSSLRDVSFRDATLDGVMFPHADLTGADFSGANLHAIFWGDSTCPDGTRSVDHGGTCEGHLNTDTVNVSPERIRGTKPTISEERKRSVDALGVAPDTTLHKHLSAMGLFEASISGVVVEDELVEIDRDGIIALSATMTSNPMSNTPPPEKERSSFFETASKMGATRFAVVSFVAPRPEAPTKLLVSFDDERVVLVSRLWPIVTLDE